MNLRINCPKCGGKVMEDIESAKFIDLACVYCSARWFIPKDKYRKALKRLEAKFKPVITGK